MNRLAQGDNVSPLPLVGFVQKHSCAKKDPGDGRRRRFRSFFLFLVLSLSVFIAVFCAALGASILRALGAMMMLILLLLWDFRSHAEHGFPQFSEYRGQVRRRAV